MTTCVEASKFCPHCGSQMKHRNRKDRKDRGGWVCDLCNRNHSRKYRAEQPDKAFDTKLWTYYRIRFDDYLRMLKRQNYCCAACGTPVSELKGGTGSDRLTVDHDHRCCPPGRFPRSCGKCVRGLICSHCNFALGHVNDDLEHLERLIVYLKKWRRRR